MSNCNLKQSMVSGKFDSCRWFGLGFLLYWCIGTPLLFSSYRFGYARGFWHYTATQHNLWATYCLCLVSQINVVSCCMQRNDSLKRKSRLTRLNALQCHFAQPARQLPGAHQIFHFFCMSNVSLSYVCLELFLIISLWQHLAIFTTNLFEDNVCNHPYGVHVGLRFNQVCSVHHIKRAALQAQRVQSGIALHVMKDCTSNGVQCRIMS